MPRDIEFSYTSLDDPKVHSVATEEELLEFANKVREAGGGDIIPALLPSYLGDADACLIARALNFQCSVDGIYDSEEDWAMDVHDVELAIELDARIPELELLLDKYGNRTPRLKLPEHIGNAAAAFDTKTAFTEFIIKPDETTEDWLFGKTS